MAAPITGCAKVASDGTVTQVGPRIPPDVNVTAEDVEDTSKLARFITSIFRDLAALKARWYPRRVDFEDVVVVTSRDYSFQHNFNGRVRWWPVEWSSGSAVPPTFVQQISTTANTLVLGAYQDGTVTIRIEEVG